MPICSHHLKISVQNPVDKTPGSLPSSLVVFKVYFDSSKIFQPNEMLPYVKPCTVFNNNLFPMSLNLKRMMEEIEIEKKVGGRWERSKKKPKPYMSTWFLCFFFLWMCFKSLIKPTSLLVSWRRNLVVALYLELLLMDGAWELNKNMYSYRLPHIPQRSC